MDSIIEFGKLALHNAKRMSFHCAEFYPMCEALMVVTTAKGVIIGARVFFEPPCKAVWVSPSGDCNYGAYDGERKTQSPLNATYYVFTELGELKDPVVYENPTS